MQSTYFPNRFRGKSPSKGKQGFGIHRGIFAPPPPAMVITPSSDGGPGHNEGGWIPSTFSSAYVDAIGTQSECCSPCHAADPLQQVMTRRWLTSDLGLTWMGSKGQVKNKESERLFCPARFSFVSATLAFLFSPSLINVSLDCYMRVNLISPLICSMRGEH